MIAVVQDRATHTVCLYRTLRGYVGGNIEPADFSTEHVSNEDALALMGVRRIGVWRPVEGRSGDHYAEVEAVSS